MFAPCRTTPKRSPRRRGSAPVELLIVLPVFLLILFGIGGLADLLITEQLLSEASARGARTAALGGTKAEIEASVRAVLGPVRSKNVNIEIGIAEEKQSASQAASPSTDGNNGSEQAEPVSVTTGVPPGQLIAVRVSAKVRDVAATRLVPLGGNELLVGQTVMQKE